MTTYTGILYGPNPAAPESSLFGYIPSDTPTNTAQPLAGVPWAQLAASIVSSFFTTYDTWIGSLLSDWKAGTIVANVYLLNGDVKVGTIYVQKRSDIAPVQAPFAIFLGSTWIGYPWVQHYGYRTADFFIQVGFFHDEASRAIGDTFVNWVEEALDPDVVYGTKTLPDGSYLVILDQSLIPYDVYGYDTEKGIVWVEVSHTDISPGRTDYIMRFVPCTPPEPGDTRTTPPSGTQLFDAIVTGFMYEQDEAALTYSLGMPDPGESDIGFKRKTDREQEGTNSNENVLDTAFQDARTGQGPIDPPDTLIHGLVHTHTWTNPYPFESHKHGGLNVELTFKTLQDDTKYALDFYLIRQGDDPSLAKKLHTVFYNQPTAGTEYHYKTFVSAAELLRLWGLSSTSSLTLDRMSLVVWNFDTGAITYDYTATLTPTRHT